MKSFLLEVKDPPLLHNQYHFYWWPGNTRSQGKSCNGVDLILLEYSYYSTRKFQIWYLMTWKMWLLIAEDILKYNSEMKNSV